MSIQQIRYFNNQIVIGLRLSPDREIAIQTLRSIYVKFFIRTLAQRVEDLARIVRKDIRILNDIVIIKFKLDTLHKLRKSQLEIESFTLKFQDGSQSTLFIDRKYNFVDIIYEKPVLATKIPSIKANAIQNKKFQESIRNISQEQKEFKKQLTVQQEIISITQDTTPDQIQKTLEQKIESQVDKELPHLQAEVSELTIGILNLILSNLPQPDNEEENLLVGSMISSIKKYLDKDISLGGGVVT